MSSKISPAAFELATLYNKPPEFVQAAINIFKPQLPLPRFRTPDDGLGDFISHLTSHYDVTPSMTKQEFTAECDLNTIMKRFIASDFDPSTIPTTTRKAFYGDLSAMPDSYHAALNYVRATEQMFLELPADLRARFDNDPQQFINFVEDPANTDELVKLGFLSSEPLPEASGDRAPQSAPKGAQKPSSGEGDGKGE